MKLELVSAAIINLACCFSLNAYSVRAIINPHNLDENGVIDLIHAIVRQTESGINATDLYKAAKIVKENADRLSPGVSQEDRLNTLLAAATEVGVQAVIQAILDNVKTDSDGLTDVVTKIDATEKTLNVLATQAKNSGAGNNAAVFAAVSKGADFLIDLMPALVGHAIEYVTENYKRDITQDTNLFVARSVMEGSHLDKRGGSIRVRAFGVEIDIKWN